MKLRDEKAREVATFIKAIKVYLNIEDTYPRGEEAK